MISFEQDADGVTAVIRDRDSGKQSTVRARYMVAADGSRSRVREQLGIRMLGHGVFSKSATIYFRADVNPLLRGRNLSIILIVHPEMRGFFRIEKPFKSGFLAVNTLGDADRPQTDVTTGLDEKRCLELVHMALGDASAPVEIDNVMHWESQADVAERFQQGRIFLAGDAAHVMPPYGGFGGNTGIADAHNLAWKLALVLKGVSGPELLATYEPERRPASAFTVEQAYTRYVVRSAQYLGTSGMQKPENDLNIELGYCYHSTAVIPENDDDGRAHENPRESKGRPGRRAPHLFIEHNGRKISTLDLFGGNFVLLTAEGQAWCDAASEASRSCGVDIDVHRIADSAFCEAYGITPGGAVLVRPDGFVAWRAKTAEGASTAAIAQVLRNVLSMPARAAVMLKA